MVRALPYLECGATSMSNGDPMCPECGGYLAHHKDGLTCGVLYWQTMMTRPRSPDMMEMARKVVLSQAERQDEDIEEWAARIADQVKDLND